MQEWRSVWRRSNETYSFTIKSRIKEALASALRLQSMLDKITHLSFECRRIDVLRTPLGTVLEPNSIDVVITDVPYGGTVQWSEEIADQSWSCLAAFVLF